MEPEIELGNLSDELNTVEIGEEAKSKLVWRRHPRARLSYKVDRSPVRCPSLEKKPQQPQDRLYRRPALVRRKIAADLSGLPLRSRHCLRNRGKTLGTPVSLQDLRRRQSALRKKHQSDLRQLLHLKRRIKDLKKCRK